MKRPQRAFELLEQRRLLATINWSGASAGNLWSEPANWEGDVAPGATDTALFPNTGGSGLPREITNSLGEDRTVGGLAFLTTGSTSHTTDLGGHTLQVLGNLNFNANDFGSGTNRLQNGELIVDAPLSGLNAGGNGTADLSGLSQFSARLADVVVGDERYGQGSVLQLATNNQLLIEELAVGRDGSRGTVRLESAGRLTLGSADRPTLLSVAEQVGGRDEHPGRIDFSRGRQFDAQLDGIMVGRQWGGRGTAIGEVLGAASGDVVVGTPGTPGQIIVAQSSGGKWANGLLDFSRQDSLTAIVDRLYVGQRGTGLVHLAERNHLDADLIVLGQGGDATVSLGHENMILASELRISDGTGNGTITAPIGARLTLGSFDRPMAFSLADQLVNKKTHYNALIDLSAADRLSAVFGDVIVGRKLGREGTTFSRFIGAGSGNVQIGSRAAPADFIVGQRVGAGAVQASVDWSGQTSLDAYLDRWVVGEGNATAEVHLPQVSRIDVKTAAIGEDGWGTLTLSGSTTITAENFAVGRGRAEGSVLLPVGGLLRIGSPTDRGNLEIGRMVRDCRCTHQSEIDASHGTFVGYFDEVIIGDKDSTGGTGVGLLRIGDDDENIFSANSVQLAAGLGKSIGEIHIAGGEITIGQLRGGIGKEVFRWTGGVLHVDQYGDPVHALTLENHGSGRLAPGQGIGKTTVYGDYSQTEHAALEIEIASTAEHDVLEVHGRADLGGALQVSFEDGTFRPEVGDRFDLIDFETASGEFDEIVLPELPSSLRWNVEQLSTTGEIIVEAGVLRGTVLEQVDLARSDQVQLGDNAVEWRVEDGGNGHFYARSWHANTWHKVQNEAVARGGHLATITSAEEQAFIFQHFPPNVHHWIGLTDELFEGDYRWVSGEEFVYSNWRYRQPDNSGNEDHVHLMEGGWNDFSSSNKIHGVIEFRVNKPLAGWTVYLDANDNGQHDGGERFTLTDEDGSYELDGLLVGEYIVRQELPPGWEQLNPIENAHQVFLPAAGVVDRLDFGNRRLPEVRLDVDQMTIPEAGGVATFTVTLAQPSDVPVLIDLEISGTAESADYTTTGTQIVIAAGAKRGSLVLTAMDDDLDEPAETVTVAISAVTNASATASLEQTIVIVDDDDLVVTTVDPNDSGFVAEFNRAFAIASSNQNKVAGEMHLVTLVGAAVGPVDGSLVATPGSNKLEFIKTGGPLSPDTYAVTLRASGLRDRLGNVLDGDRDGDAGGDYSYSFTISAGEEEQVTVGVSDIVLGPSSGNRSTALPVSISNGGGVRTVDFRLRYNPELVDITGATASLGLPANSQVAVDHVAPGLATVSFSSPVALPDGHREIVNLQMRVPNGGIGQYGRLQVLDVHAVTIGDGSDLSADARDDDGLHLVALLGDVTGNGRIDANDASRIAIYAAFGEAGFMKTGILDPMIVADISGNGRVNGFDAALVAHIASGATSAVVPRPLRPATEENKVGGPPAFDIALLETVHWDAVWSTPGSGTSDWRDDEFDADDDEQSLDWSEVIREVFEPPSS